MTAVPISIRLGLGVQARRAIGNAITYLLLALFSLFVFVPVAYMISTSLKTEDQLFIWPIRWIPNPIAWENYPRAFVELGRIAPGLTFWRILSNTLFITVLAMTAELIAVSLVAYGFARFRFPGRNFLFIVMLSTMMLPGIITLIPTFLIWRTLGLIDTYDPLVNAIWFGGGAWAVFMLRQFFLTIPREMEEAALIDGANTFQIYYKIMLPLVRPALLALGVLIFQGNWNNFMGPLIYLNTTVKFPLIVALKFFQESLSKEAPKWHYMMAMSTVMATPILVLYFAAQRYFIEGLMVGAVKG
ncbi:MAG: carbohydrate ABC transporter permease [Anaerolineae bacterium]|nr:carbohydrate ABC transporter permease [Anaerolineae bacterium]MCX8066555.1 carbohydrate ABC transporter permease [Anaerolineae bacterium]MDW7990554.1 carbohydrate ABC transporter permease [Anaerolineae bacterium]